MALLTTQVLSPLTGNVVTTAAVSASDTITPDASKLLILTIINANASPDTVTLAITSGADPFGRAYPVQVITVANGTTKQIYLFNNPLLADITTGLITVTHSVTATVTCSVVAVAK